MTKDYIIIHPCNVFSQGNPAIPNFDENFDIVDMYQLHDTDLSGYKCMIIVSFVDQDYLYEERDIIARFLENRNIVCFFGNLVTDWLPGAKPFIVKEIRSHLDYDISIAKPHPIFEGVLEDDMTINKGVKGFFARGHHPQPAGAEVLLTLPGGEPVTYIDRETTVGTIFVHSGGNLFDHVRMEKNVKKTTERISPQIMQWVQDEYQRLQEGVIVNA